MADTHGEGSQAFEAPPRSNGLIALLDGMQHGRLARAREADELYDQRTSRGWAALLWARFVQGPGRAIRSVGHFRAGDVAWLVRRKARAVASDAFPDCLLYLQQDLRERLVGVHVKDTSGGRKLQLPDDVDTGAELLRWRLGPPLPRDLGGDM